MIWYHIDRVDTGAAIWHRVTGPRFTNALTSILMKWSLQNFAHGTTAMLSWHVQKFVAIWWPATELQQGEIFIVCELWAKMKPAPGPHWLMWWMLPGTTKSLTEPIWTRTIKTPAFWDTPRRSMITHTGDSHQVPSQNKTKSSKLQTLKNCQKLKF